jgi:hypothetical protein
VVLPVSVERLEGTFVDPPIPVYFLLGAWLNLLPLLTQFVDGRETLVQQLPALPRVNVGFGQGDSRPGFVATLDAL